NPASLLASEMVNALIKSLKTQAPPKQIHRPAINLRSTLLELRRIDIDSPSTPIVHLQKKLSFLLGMTAFLHPSEFHRTDFSTAAIKTDSGRHFLFLQVIAPKEKHGGQRIMVTITINTWLRRLLRFSSDEPRINLRSLSSSAALHADVDINDIITLGNWSFSAVFEQHYRREQLSLVDFTSSVLPVPADDNVFHDAESSFD
ncbi:hypothetical protein BCV72DRAFT_212635, partial [Rhizopus microsporus var. microsporus]